VLFYQSSSLMSAKLSRGSSMWGNIVSLIRFSYQKYGITSKSFYLNIKIYTLNTTVKYVSMKRLSHASNMQEIWILAIQTLEELLELSLHHYKSTNNPPPIFQWRVRAHQGQEPARGVLQVCHLRHLSEEPGLLQLQQQALLHIYHLIIPTKHPLVCVN